MSIFGCALVGLLVGVMVQQLALRQNETTGKSNQLPLIAVILSVNLMSAIDALSTIYLVANNQTTELNPIMNSLIHHNFVLFFVVKLLITLVATLVCWHYYERRRKARMILKLASSFYCFLMAWHCLLLWSVLS
jgi:hypothetical protein